MVNTDKAVEGDFITADFVNNSPTKLCTPIDEGNYEDSDFGDRLTITVEIDGKRKKYRPNKDTVTNLRNEYGKDSKEWIGKLIRLKTVRFKGKDIVHGEPAGPRAPTSAQVNA